MQNCEEPGNYTPIELKNVKEFGTNNWKSLSDLGKSNVESNQYPFPERLYR